MAIVGATALIANFWISRAQWVWLFRIEEAALAINTGLNIVLPKALWAKLVIVLAIFCLKLALPHLLSWLVKFEKVLSFTFAVCTPLALFVGFTLFGGIQAAEIGKTVSTEKYKRVEQEAIAVAELIISTRLTEQREMEVQAALSWLDAVKAGVQVDLEWRESRVGVDENVSRRMDWISDSVQRRVAELREAILQQPYVYRSVEAMDHRLETLLGRKLTEQDRAEAKKAFESSLKHFVAEVITTTSHPLTNLLKIEEAPELMRNLVIDLYKAEFKFLAKAVTDPLTDALFRPNSQSAVTALEKISDIARQPVFDPNTLPRKVVNPTVFDKVEEEKQRSRIREIVGRAARR